MALHVTDWGQTLYIADNPQKFHETNPVLGSHPSRDQVNLYFLATGIGHAAVSYLVPDEVRPYWQYGTIGLEIYCVGSNFSAGVGFGF
jgi:hypothetical protein